MVGSVVPVPPSTSGAFRPGRDVLTAWLLLFLAHGDGYGYGLADQLREQAIDFETTSAYRALRALERDGHVTSRWTESRAGPRRRLYSLTAAGRRALDQFAALVTGIRDLNDGFVRTYERGVFDPQGESSMGPGKPGALRPEKELLTAWLLLLLDGNVSYGYELRQRLGEHDLIADPGTVYRLLRRLERDRLLQSRWTTAVIGPQRRLYRLTTRGRRNLHEIATLIERTRDVHEAFVQAYACISEDCERPARQACHGQTDVSAPAHETPVETS